ncbi:leucyl aminopeptidase [Echinococcus multilocularis]|uniref:Leucyl aminopeptidase n=1 Tax=Echinococcus multilocularis TaxID=6211 RepID=A0A0S4MMW6_ECHMU|nr:leucyl aminopeptidase [Echinococcus multilocularis]
MTFGVKRHKGAVEDLAYNGGSTADTTFFLLCKGITYDKGDIDAKYNVTSVGISFFFYCIASHVVHHHTSFCIISPLHLTDFDSQMHFHALTFLSRISVRPELLPPPPPVWFSRRDILQSRNYFSPNSYSSSSSSFACVILRRCYFAHPRRHLSSLSSHYTLEREADLIIEFALHVTTFISYIWDQPPLYSASVPSSIQPPFCPGVILLVSTLHQLSFLNATPLSNLFHCILSVALPIATHLSIPSSRLWYVAPSDHCLMRDRIVGGGYPGCTRATCKELQDATPAPLKSLPPSTLLFISGPILEVMQYEADPWTGLSKLTAPVLLGKIQPLSLPVASSFMLGSG